MLKSAAARARVNTAASVQWTKDSKAPQRRKGKQLRSFKHTNAHTVGSGDWQQLVRSDCAQIVPAVLLSGTWPEEGQAPL